MTPLFKEFYSKVSKGNDGEDGKIYQSYKILLGLELGLGLG
jgi:hypothetical protein